MEYIQLIAGLLLLFISGDFLIKSGVSLAHHFNVPAMVIGLTVVSMGTSLPELFVSAEAAVKGFPEMAIGNVIGSNIANIALVLALTIIVFPMVAKKATVYFDTPVMIVISVLLYAILFDNRIGFIEGLIFISLLFLYVYWTFRKSTKLNDGSTRKTKLIPPRFSVRMSVFILISSSVGLKFGAEWLVNGAVYIAEKLNVSETVISVTVVAFGTSIPELATSLIAAFKKEPDISVGNIVGSNIFNILGVLGITAMIKPIEVSDPMVKGFHIFWMIGIAVLLLLSILPVFKYKLRRINGIIFVALYIVYIYLMF